jgi:hypothetical protein
VFYRKTPRSLNTNFTIFFNIHDTCTYHHHIIIFILKSVADGRERSRLELGLGLGLGRSRLSRSRARRPSGTLLPWLWLSGDIEYDILPVLRVFFFAFAIMRLSLTTLSLYSRLTFILYRYIDHTFFVD